MNCDRRTAAGSNRTEPGEATADGTAIFELGDRDRLEELLSAPSAVFEVLSRREGRDVIRYLLDQETSSSVPELATYVVACERQVSPTAVVPDERDEATVGLIHVHLPKLADFGVIEWDREDDDVRLRGDDIAVEYPGAQDGGRVDE